MKLSRWINDLACASRGHHMHLDVADESGHTWRCRNCGTTAHYEPQFVVHSAPSKTLLKAAIKEGTPPRRLYADRDLGDESPLEHLEVDSLLSQLQTVDDPKEARRLSAQLVELADQP